MFKKYLVLVALTLVMAVSASAQNTPSDVKDLVGARASSGETQLEKRGYTFIKVEKGEDRTWQNWWHPTKKVCLTVVTIEGRYDAINAGVEFDCKQDEESTDDEGMGSDTPSDVQDLVGARASGGETQLEKRGYTFVKVEKGEDRTWQNWWNNKTKTCLTVLTVEGRYEAITKSPAFDCNKD